jgi:hypothetical protein
MRAQDWIGLQVHDDKPIDLATFGNTVAVHVTLASHLQGSEKTSLDGAFPFDEKAGGIFLPLFPQKPFPYCIKLALSGLIAFAATQRKAQRATR